MPPKQNKSGRKKPHRVDLEGNEIRDDDEEYPRVWNNSRKRWQNIRAFSDILPEEQRAQDAARAQLPAYIRKHTQLLEANDDDALDEWRATQGVPVTRDPRKAAHDAWTKVQIQLEDFLYYQNTIPRRTRMSELENEEELEKEESKREKTGAARPTQPARGPWKFPHGKDTWLQGLLNKYDNMRVGSAEHRHGFIDPYEADKREDGETIRALPTPYRVRPHELGLWTPQMRAAPVGLQRTEDAGEDEEMEDVIEDSAAAKALDAVYRPDLDLVAIDEKRR
jgi:hypothetical protein